MHRPAKKTNDMQTPQSKVLPAAAGTLIAAVMKKYPVGLLIIVIFAKRQRKPKNAKRHEINVERVDCVLNQ